MRGQLSDDLFIEAVITDQNIPYQPEGNTQQIRDFDNVFIKVFNNDFNLTAGDVVLVNPWAEEGYFLKYYKNVLGIQINYRSDTMKKWVSSTHLAGSASKGKFASIQVVPIEGSQGPYRLRGPNGERFVIVLANSEKVFLDGQQLVRGFDRDYVIDYNLGEITFNANVLITPFSRIRVDFEYAEQFYARSNLSLGQSVKSADGGLGLRINYYQERDNPNVTLGFQPSSADLAFLNGIGDNTGQAAVNGADSVGFDASQVRYARIDTVDLDGNLQQAFIVSTDPDLAVFQVVFSEVGLGNGDYVLSANTRNGPSYQWVSPESGQSQGNYVPEREIPLPTAKSMWTAGLDVGISPHETITQELAFSSSDVNLFSELDEGDNEGLAWMSKFISKGRTIANDYKLVAELMWEYDQPNFQRIDRYRYIEFDRDWDFTPAEKHQEDFILWGRLEANKNRQQTIQYQAARRIRDDVINGWQHRLKVNQRAGSLFYASDHFLLDNQLANAQSTWRQTFHDVSFRRFFVVPGYRFRLDHQAQTAADSVISSRMYYRSHEWYVHNLDTLNTQFRFSYEKRFDRVPIEGTFQKFQEVENFGVRLSAHAWGQRWSLDGRYRKVLQDSTGKFEEWLNARLNTNGQFLNRLINHRLTYQVGNVRVLERQFVFVEVGGNQGTHAWRDENRDDIRDLNEFYEVINPDEAQFAKIFLPTDAYITAFETRYQQNVSFRLPFEWRSRGQVLRVLSRWSGRWLMDRQYRTTASGTGRLNPFKLNLEQAEVLFAQSRIQLSLDYNLAGDGLGWSGSASEYDRKDLLANGFEFGTRDEWSSYTRWRFGPVWELGIKNLRRLYINRSDFLDNRNANILSLDWGPVMTWRPGKTIRLVVNYLQSDRKNRSEEPEPNEASIREATLDFSWRPKGGNLNAGLEWLEIDYTGENNTFVAYRMLDALQPGQNFRWRLNWQQELAEGLRVTIQYNGRKSADQVPVHTGTMVLTAFF